ncbi:hypothetical protein TanjilG_21416 [Lupinus angustifolius]|uniref:VOC domain-containing protein n=2 Tax=Lupinus angustifolius TaxID=3871 RepID=A0A4P1RN05_LUPAN|nr:hypothetical protein TanjilG_21416 [Lupinus angustifolius]
MQKQEIKGDERNTEEERNNKKERDEGKEENPAPLKALNHVSRLCRDVKKSIEFYTKVLGFVLMERPEVLDFEGAWLFNYGIGIHLVQSKEEERLPSHTKELEPNDNHICFQCEEVEEMERKLKEMNVKYMKRSLKTEDGTSMDQIFFNDPDRFMIEICNCEDFKLVPADSLGKLKLPMDRHIPPIQTNQRHHHASN